MTVNSYLDNIARNSIIRDTEKESISRSIRTLKNRLNSYFGNDLSDTMIFGSYSRNTILPRTMDNESDIDYMIVFKDSTFQPQTYLNKLRRFVEFYYSSSDIKQSNPTIILSLNHINFELVPAINNLFTGLKIPAKVSDYNNWIDTDPISFNTKLTTANQYNNNLIKPLVRLIKYWNVCNGKPFESYDIEQKIILNNSSPRNILLIGKSLRELFYEAILNLEVSWLEAQWKKEKVERAKKLINEIKLYDSLQSSLAISSLKRLLPEI